MKTQFATSSALANSAPLPCTALVSPRNFCRLVQTNVSGQFSKESDSNRKKSLQRQERRELFAKSSGLFCSIRHSKTVRHTEPENRKAEMMIKRAMPFL